MNNNSKLAMEENYEQQDEDFEKRDSPKVGKAFHSDYISDKIFDEVEDMGVMVKSEGLIYGENFLIIWGSKMPEEKVNAEKVIHHALLQVDNLAAKGNFRIIYFHSGITGKGRKIPKLIKAIWGKMSKKMRGKMRSFDIVHPNFSLKLALFFFDKISFTNYKIHFVETLEQLYERLEPDQKTFVLTWLPAEARLHDSQLSDGAKYVVSDKKLFKKVIVSTSDSKYRKFDPDTAVQTYDIIGKHISEFKRAESDLVPEIFLLLFNYFEQNEEFMKTEGVFRLAADKELLDVIEERMKEGEYEYLTSVTDPLTVAVYLKKVFREMGEPLCTFDLYSKFKDINDETWKDIDEKIETAQELLDQLPLINRETFKALLNFLYRFTLYGDSNKMKSKNLAIVFAPNLFRAYEVTPNDMIYAQVLVKTLELMIEYWRD